MVSRFQGTVISPSLAPKGYLRKNTKGWAVCFVLDNLEVSRGPRLRRGTSQEDLDPFASIHLLCLICILTYEDLHLPGPGTLKMNKMWS